MGVDGGGRRGGPQGGGGSRSRGSCRGALSLIDEGELTAIVAGVPLEVVGSSDTGGPCAAGYGLRGGGCYRGGSG